MQQSDVYYQLCLNMFRALLCPSSGEQRPYVTARGVLRWFCWMWLVAVVGRCVVGCEQCWMWLVAVVGRCVVGCEQCWIWLVAVVGRCVVGCEQCWMWLVVVVGRCVVGCEHCSQPTTTTQRPTTTTNHIRQNQRSSPYAVTHGLCSPEDGHNDARNMLRKC